VLPGDDLATVLLELGGIRTGRAKGLALLDERRDLALEALDAGVRIRHDSTYDAQMQSLAAVVRKKCVKGENRLMLGEALEERIRELALSFPETYEDHPWGDFPVFKVGSNKVFAWLTIEPKAVQLTLKLTAEEREIAHLLPYVSIARYVGRYGWITATVSDEETLASALEWLRESYWLKAPAGVREAAWA
jgi:predicted DNA-binding protein (MmcQ/YjbR family)